MIKGAPVERLERSFYPMVVNLHIFDACACGMRFFGEMVVYGCVERAFGI